MVSNSKKPFLIPVTLKAFQVSLFSMILTVVLSEELVIYYITIDTIENINILCQ